MHERTCQTHRGNKIGRAQGVLRTLQRVPEGPRRAAGGPPEAKTSAVVLIFRFIQTKFSVFRKNTRHAID